ncbi:hypothetical protein [Paraburkholderia sp. BCC1886]|uniref:hypothetical protein n=1 Tax=Paraburkholderia sp. BCC1886 TaxID=2562670 RepID=UPI00118409D2|nr:hypothetical protein [Paraburkholderia sp. BCC1886]
MGYFVRGPQEPDNIILETRGLMAELYAQIPEMAAEDDHSLIDRAMECLAYEKRAEDQLTSLCYELLSDVMALPGESREIPYLALPGFDLESRHRQAVERATAGANQIYRFGNEVLALCRNLGLYRNGYLHYHLTDWIGRDMVLTRTLVPVIHLNRPMETATDDDLYVLTPLRKVRRR